MMSREFELCPGRRIGGEQPCFIIAEIGQNHQGDLDIAKRMIRMAKVRGDCPASGGRVARPAGRLGGRAAAPRRQGRALSRFSASFAGWAGPLARMRQASGCG